MLKLEYFVFIRSLPQFSANLFEDLERLEPYTEIIEAKKDGIPVDENGWSLVFRGKIKTKPGRVAKSKDLFYHRANDQLEVMEPSILIFFSEDNMERLLRKEPELAIPLAEKMKLLKDHALAERPPSV